jgi:hypothetical protein
VLKELVHGKPFTREGTYEHVNIMLWCMSAPEFEQFLANQSLDIRSSRYRFMDQKVAPDVISFVSDCILNLPNSTQGDFKKNDIWHSGYFDSNVQLVFSKPGARNIFATNEYDKFTSQPLKSLSYAGVLKEWKIGRENHYSIQDIDILERISKSPTAGYSFMISYLEAVFKSSGFWHHFETYKNSSFSDADLQLLKTKFEQFIIGNTEINGKTEARRIFPKSINPLCVASGIPGVAKGHVTDSKFNFADLMYNRENFRDADKAKQLTRAENTVIVAEDASAFASYLKYEVNKAMGAVKRYHQPKSEVSGAHMEGSATQVHHIFPRSTHPELAAIRENLVLLTPTQHYTLAHPNNNTSKVDPNYQLDCLLAKVTSVQKSISKGDEHYSISQLINVINVGYEIAIPQTANLEEIRLRLTGHRVNL